MHFHVHVFFSNFAHFALRMAIVPYDRIPLQQLLRPVFIADRQLCILHECLTQLLDASDYVDGQGATHALNLTIAHLQRTIELVKIGKLLHLVRLQRALHLEWQRHGVVPPIDWELEE